MYQTGSYVVSRTDVSCSMTRAAAAKLIERDAVLQYLRRKGLRTTSDQLTRWHKAGLIPRPKRQSLGRGRGMRSLYPVITLPQAHAAAFALRITRSLPEARWMVWCLGFPGLTKLVKRDLSDILKRYERDFRTALAAFARGEQGNPISELATSRRVSSDWGPVRRRIGSARVETVARMLHEIALGRLDESRGYEPEDFTLARDAILARDPSVAAALTTDPSLMREALLTASRELNLPLVGRALRSAPEWLLVLVRKEAASLWRGYVGILPETWASIPTPEFFLLWLSFRWISPTLNEAVNEAVERQEIPMPEDSAFDKMVQSLNKATTKRRPRRKTEGKK